MNTKRFFLTLIFSITLFCASVYAEDSSKDDIKSPSFLSIGIEEKGTLTTASDSDFFKFTTSKKGKYFIKVYSSKYLISSSIYTHLCDEFGNIIKYDAFGIDFFDSNKIYYVKVYGVGDEFPIDYNISVTFYEDVEGDSIDSANMFKLDETIAGKIDNYEDYDYFKFKTTEKGIYTFELNRKGYYGPSMSLYDSSGKVFKSGNGTSTGTLINEELQENATYYIWVGGYSGSDPFPIDYSITASFSKDDYGNNISNSKEISVYNEVYGTVDYKKDIDLLKFTAPKSDYVVIEGLTDPEIMVRLYNLAFTPVSSVYGTSLNSNYISEKLTAGDTYYIEVSGDYLHSTGSYSFKVKGINDDYGNDFSSAWPIKIGNELTGKIENRDDKDVFCFETSEDAYYYIDCTGGEEVFGYLYKENGDSIGMELHGGGYFYSPIAIPLEGNKKYYIKIGVSAKTSQYKISLKKIDDDYGNDTSLAAPIKAETQVNGSIEVIGDTDYFSFTPDKSGIYIIESINDDDVFTTGYIFDDKGFCLGKNSGGGTSYNFRIRQRLKKSQRYFIKICSEVEGYGTKYNMGHYGFKITYTDDYGDDLNEAELIQEGVITPGSIGYENDIDCFYFMPNKDGHYIVQSTTKGENSITAFGSLYDSSGRLILGNSFPTSKNFFISEDLVANQIYFIRIQDFMHKTGDYFVSVFPDSPAVPFSCQISGQRSIVIPIAGSTTSSYDVTFKDQNGVVMDNQSVTWAVYGSADSQINTPVINTKGLLSINANTIAGEYKIRVQAISYPDVYSEIVINVVKSMPEKPSGSVNGSITINGTSGSNISASNDNTDKNSSEGALSKVEKNPVTDNSSRATNGNIKENEIKKPAMPTSEDADNKATVKEFKDLEDYPWAINEIKFLNSRGIINGISETTFAPSINITRADFIVLLIKTLDLKADFESNFYDISKKDYYYEATGIAKKLGISDGIGGNKFNPKAFITRQDLMTFIAKALKLAYKLNQAVNETDLNIFSDKEIIVPYAAESIALMVKEGIVQGSNGRIKPTAYATRAETAVIMYRIYNKKK